MGKVVDITGQRFGRLIAIALNGRSPDRQAVWACECECGERIDAKAGNLKSGNTQSCGCWNKEKSIGNKDAFKHGKSHSSEYRIWVGMKGRCRNPKTKRYEHWGGRGITYDPKWEDFSAFYADMGPKPSAAHSIDRIDNDGPYAPWNCRWATPKEQANNRR